MHYDPCPVLRVEHVFEIDGMRGMFSILNQLRKHWTSVCGASRAVPIHGLSGLPRRFAHRNDG